MLFMGTEKYPDESEYTNFVQTRGGYTNAYTAGDHTNYHFEVGAKCFLEVLDRFSQFFTRPLFKEDCISRELKAVESEFRQYEFNDNWRINQASRLLFDQFHPEAKFNVGNLKTLEIENIRDRLIKFYETHYSANRMKLVIKGRDSINKLEDSVIRMFSEVPKRNTREEKLSNDPFGKRERGAFMKIKTLSPKDLLTISFLLPSTRDRYQFKTLELLSHLVNYEGAGGLYNILANTGMALSVGASISPETASYAIFKVNVHLTENGFKSIGEIVLTVLRFMERVQADIPDWIFSDYRRIQKISFDYKESSDSVRVLTKMVEQMFWLKPRDLLFGPYMISRPDIPRIQKFAQMMNADNLLVTLSSDKFDDADMQSESWYGTKYSLEKIDLSNVKPVAERFELPPQNLYIPTNFKILGKKVADPKQEPTRLVSKLGIPVWYKLDDTFMFPKTIYRLLIRPNIEFESPAVKEVWSFLLISLLDYDLKEISYNAKVAGLAVNLKGLDEGLEILFSGFSDKLPTFMKYVADFFARYQPSEATFHAQRDKAFKLFKAHQYRSAYQMSSTELSLALSSPQASIDDDLKVIQELKFESFVEYLTRYKSAGFDAEALVMGNISDEDSINHVDMFLQVGFKEFKRQDLEFTTRFTQLKDGESSVIVDYVFDSNFAVNTYIQTGLTSSAEDRAMILLIDTALGHLPFQILRTEQALGYAVSMHLRFDGPFIGLSISVQSPKNDPKDLDDRIRSMIDTRFPEALDAIKEEDFDSFKTTAVNLLQERSTKLKDEADQYWSKISYKLYEFQRRKETIETISKLSLDNFKEYTRAKIISGRKSVSIHVWPEKSGSANYDGNSVYYSGADFTKDHESLGYERSGKRA